MDNVSKETRSRIMSSIRGKNTKPEITIRRLLWSKGMRYRIHNKRVFGIPDITNRSKSIAIFIDGCFWHGCSICYKEPKTNTGFWRDKVKRNAVRRKQVVAHLKKENWTVLEYWEHEINSNPEKIVKEISRYF